MVQREGLSGLGSHVWLTSDNATVLGLFPGAPAACGHLRLGRETLYVAPSALCNYRGSIYQLLSRVRDST